MKLSHTLFLFPVLFCSSYAQSSIDPSSLIKVTTDTNPQCVEYYTYQGDMYCSTKALASQQIDPQLIHLEKQTIKFDDRPWQAVWGKKTDTITTLEYVPAGDNIDQWNELVTTQFIPDLQKKATLNQLLESIINNLKKTGLNPDVHIIDNKPNYILFEFKVHDPANLRQDELQKITLGTDGIYILHYAIKQASMSDENREKWLDNLRKSGI